MDNQLNLFEQPKQEKPEDKFFQVERLVSNVDLMHGDCLKLMFDLPDNSVDMVCCDMPYGTTACKWDTVLPLDMLWHHYGRIVKEGGAIVLFCAQPFSSFLIISNTECFKYSWVYEKTNAKGFQSVKHKPLSAHEDIAVFCKGKKAMKVYNPQMWECPPAHVVKRKTFTLQDCGEVYGGGKKMRKQESTTKYPRTVIPVSNHTPRTGFLHPTQKPVALIEYLIKTYTNEGDTVLDNCMGSGTTGVACKNLGRDFIGIELDEEYFETAKARIESC